MVHPMILQAIAAFLLVLCSAFFSCAETAITAASPARMHILAAQGSGRAAKVNKLFGRVEQVIGTVLLATSFLNSLLAALTTTVLTGYFGGSAAAFYAAAATTALIFIFGEVMPKTYAINNADRTALALAPVLLVLVKLCSPLTRLTQFVSTGLLRLFGARAIRTIASEESMEELRGAIDLHAESAEEIREAGAMLHSILDLDGVPVSDIMVHRGNMTMIDAGLPMQEIVSQTLASPHTRIPLWRDEPDNIVGVLHAKALLRALRANDWKVDGINAVALAAKPWFVPDSTSLLAQLEAFKRRHEHFAIVVDEYGALMGIVTLEDIIEEIVGNIVDEHDTNVVGVRREPDGSYIIDGIVTLRDLNRELGWKLPDAEASTIAGLVLYEARQIPAVGQIFVFHGLRLEILERQRNQIKKLRATPLQAASRGTEVAAEKAVPEDATRATGAGR